MRRVVLPGAAGKMGRTLIRILAESEGLILHRALERPGHGDLGRDAGALAGLGPLGVPITDDFAAALEGADVAIDFTAPRATIALAEAAAAARVALVIGTTGLGPAERAVIEGVAATVPVVLSPNMSVGVNVLFGLLELAARTLGPSYDVEIVELHHRLKRDAPSGTALGMAEVLARAQGRDVESSLLCGRRGDLGPRPDDQIGVLAVRGGDVVGEHTAYFLGAGDRLEITHRASSRETFARGAIRAARWLAGRGPGLYDMRDVLALR